jgi:hypothetical protein
VVGEAGLEEEVPDHIFTNISLFRYSVLSLRGFAKKKGGEVEVEISRDGCKRGGTR